MIKTTSKRNICQSVPSNISFLQLNLGHRVLAHDSLMAWLWTQNKNWILMIQEPFFTRKGLSKLPKDYGGFWAEDENQRKKVRSLIIAPKMLQGYLVSQISNKDCVIVRFNMTGFSVASIYCPLDERIESNMNGLMEENNDKRKIICGMDSNSYHPRWGSNLRVNKKWSGKRRGEELNEIIDSNGFMICNIVPHLATFTRDSASKNESHIDVIICTADLFNVIDDWQVKDETFSSDHRAIMFVIKRIGDDVLKGNIVYGVPWKKPKGRMKEVMESAICERIKLRGRTSTTKSIDETVEEHTRQVSKVLNQVFKKKNKSKKSQDVYWWNDQVAAAYKKMRLARRRMRKYGYEDLKEVFKKERGNFRYVAKESKKVVWIELMQGINDPWEKLIKIIKATMTGKMQSRTLKDLDGRYADDLKETLNFLGRQFYPPPLPKNDHHLHVENEVEKVLSIPHEGPKFTICELNHSISRMKSSSAPGFDQITYNVIKLIMKNESNKEKLLEIFNKCVKLSHFPSKWKEAKIVLIPKLTMDNNSVKAYRPISLTAAYGKLFERLILERINYYLLQSNVMNPNQHAYQKGKSTQTALYEMFDTIQCALYRRGGEKTICVIVFLDISGAFDKTWHHGILFKLLSYGVPLYIVKWIKCFLHERKAFFSDGDEKLELVLEQGCPQGGVLSPVLWNVLFNEMLGLPVEKGKNKRNRLNVIGYADDAALVCKAASVEEASCLLNVHLNKIFDWSKRNRVTFNPSKLAVLVMSNRVVKPPPAAVFYDGILIKEVEVYKYLGLTVDNKCTWKLHIQGVLDKLSTITRSLKGLMNVKGGVRLDIFRTLFHSIFMPVMTYGMAIWGWKAVHKVTCSKFDKCMRQFALLATRCQKSTATVFLFGLLKTPDFASILEQEVLKTSVQQFHIVHTEREKVYESYAKKRIKSEIPQSLDHHFFMLRRKLENKVNNLVFDDVRNIYAVHPSQWLENVIKIDRSVEAIWKGSDNKGWTLFTDASRSTHGVGWGFAVMCSGILTHRDYGSLSECTIFTAEAFALKKAIDFAANIKGTKIKEEIEVRTDALGLLMAIQSKEIMDPILGQIGESLRNAKKLGKNLVMSWVPSHSDIYGNELADALAKKGTDNNCPNEVSCTQRDVKRFLKERKNAMQKRSWDAFASRNVKFFLPDINMLNSFLKSSPSHALCQLISGHTRLNDFLCGILGLIQSSMCACKKGRETVSHFLFDCELYEGLRDEIWPDFEPTYQFVTKDWNLLNNYVLKTKRFDQSVYDVFSKQR